MGCSTQSLATTMEPTTIPEPIHPLLLSIRQGDWPGVERAIDGLSREQLVLTSAALRSRARFLEEAVMAARMVRADLAASLLRLEAANRFVSRQNFGEPTIF